MLAGFRHIHENARVENKYQNPVRLRPVEIPKPWGREIWHTGMEARGQSLVELANGTTQELSQYLSANPAASSAEQPVLLLKILDPAPTPLLGDLYFEVHEEKREVYIVTAITNAGGVGQIRFGMNQSLRAQHQDDDAFRSAYLQAVKSYEAVRRRIDERGEQLADLEQKLREGMERFTTHRDLHVGDVVCVPTWTPHALQHGVRVVEFQTQTYERYIVSFAQRVLTQDHWDSEHAIANMHLNAPEPTRFETAAPGIERIARFDDFNVWRVNATAASFQLPSNLPYAVCMAIGGKIRIGSVELSSEEACFVPHDAVVNTRCTVVDKDAHCLVAAPGL